MEKTTIVKELEEQLEKWNAEIDKLEARFNETDDKLALQEHIKELREKRDIVRAKINELFKETAEELWEELKEGTLQARVMLWSFPSSDRAPS